MMNAKHTSYLSLFLLNCNGAAWFDDVRLEELGPKGENE